MLSLAELLAMPLAGLPMLARVDLPLVSEHSFGDAG
jgi:hypothetical protein